MIDISCGKSLELCQDLHVNTITCNPFDGNLLTFTTTDHLYLCDNRQKVALFNTEKPQKSVKWSPIVPYWLATTTDHSVDIYDLRFGLTKTMRSYKQNFTECLAWSNSNADILCTASSDRSISLWSLSNVHTQLDSMPHRRTGGPLTHRTIFLISPYFQ